MSKDKVMSKKESEAIWMGYTLDDTFLIDIL